MLSEEQLNRRVPVWSALADLFLDTQFDQPQYERIADICRKAGYPKEELREIFFREVAPAFAFNLFDIAGEWAGWPDDFVQSKILRELKPSRRIWRTFKAAIMRHHMQKEWKRVEVVL
jgi:hypothetical protein